MKTSKCRNTHRNCNFQAERLWNILFIGIAPPRCHTPRMTFFPSLSSTTCRQKGSKSKEHADGFCRSLAALYPLFVIRGQSKTLQFHFIPLKTLLSLLLDIYFDGRIYIYIFFYGGGGGGGAWGWGVCVPLAWCRKHPSSSSICFAAGVQTWRGTPLSLPASGSANPRHPSGFPLFRGAGPADRRRRRSAQGRALQPHPPPPGGPPPGHSGRKRRRAAGLGGARLGLPADNGGGGSADPSPAGRHPPLPPLSSLPSLPSGPEPRGYNFPLPLQLLRRVAAAGPGPALPRASGRAAAAAPPPPCS